MTAIIGKSVYMQACIMEDCMTMDAGKLIL